MWGGTGLTVEPVTKAVAAVSKGVMIGGGADCGRPWAKSPELALAVGGVGFYDPRSSRRLFKTPGFKRGLNCCARARFRRSYERPPSLDALVWCRIYTHREVV